MDLRLPMEVGHPSTERQPLPYILAEGHLYADMNPRGALYQLLLAHNEQDGSQDIAWLLSKVAVTGLA
jgi:hypothetical protein